MYSKNCIRVKCDPVTPPPPHHHPMLLYCRSHMTLRIVEVVAHRTVHRHLDFA
jgi:hypothetical protein